MIRGAYAIAIIVLSVSSMKRPSHMMRVVCGCPQKSLKKEEYAGYARKRRQRCASLSAAHASETKVVRCCGVECRCLLIQHRPPQMSCLRAGAASLALLHRAEMAVALKRRQARPLPSSRRACKSDNFTTTLLHTHDHGPRRVYVLQKLRAARANRKQG